VSAHNEAHAQQRGSGNTQGPSDEETLRASEPPPGVELRSPEPPADKHYVPPGEPLKVTAPIIVSASALQSKMFGPIKFLVKGYVVEGATILAGKPKVGKSWLVLDMALAVARGGFCLGDVHSKEGAVLYIALEDNERRIKARITKILGEHYGDWPKNFEYATAWPRANEGGLEAIIEWISSRPNARLVVVDVLEGFRTTARGRDNLYAADYSAIKGLQSIASEMHVGIIIVHHLRKALSESGDLQDMISGSLGLPGGADSSLVLHGNAQGMVLYGRGRDLIEFEKSVRFNRDTCAGRFWVKLVLCACQPKGQLMCWRIRQSP
jgi:hypothetical protein